MKKNYNLFLLLIIFPIFLLAQDSLGEGYLFDKFKDGKVIFKNGQISNAPFNYNTLSEKLLFMSDGEMLELANPNQVVLVNIDNRIFEHIKDGLFYERIKVGDGALYVRWKSLSISKGKKGAYGVTSSTSSIDNINQISSSGNVVKLKSDEEFRVTPRNQYFLKIANKFKEFNSADSLAKLFKGHEDEIKKYIKDAQLDFNKIEDLKKAIEFCGQYNK
ncbi:hypothetical protein JGH11_17805 [Dysgonomonas sp. Marseille-P4677]|uniref:hypothetical protein n=1 Tax=Dysgonomonas sp. Marseille-P4677 TaxID=2364790 RepID=UPI001913E532|nr:hypothetical protein [Dysgonomonas sp. Marseille-P4677]MBK5722731.1 hypothetical protein [Dysgonomonas sp. Marseille-P4677]